MLYRINHHVRVNRGKIDVLLKHKLELVVATIWTLDSSHEDVALLLCTRNCGGGD